MLRRTGLVTELVVQARGASVCLARASRAWRFCRSGWDRRRGGFVSNGADRGNRQTDFL